MAIITWPGVVTTMLKDLVAGEPTLLLALTVPVKVPAVVGVPERIPAVERVRPPGKVPALKVHVGVGEPVTV